MRIKEIIMPKLAKKFVGISICTAILLLAFLAEAVPPVWTDWERSNAVAKEGEWLVIRQPDGGFCYIKQGYDGYSDKMELSMKRDGVPYLITPFFQGIQGDVSYWVDDGPVRIVREAQASALGIKLSPKVVPELRRGRKLFVRVKPAGRLTIEQTFDLRGFTAASKWLGSPTCREKVPDKHQ
jgi:hypothetical protein